MNPTSNLLLLVALAAPTAAQTNAEPRIERPLPFQSSEKIPAPAVETTPGPERPAGASVDAPAKGLEAPTRGVRPSAPIEQIGYATSQDGTTWALGRSYKAGFGSGGATYVPFFGSAAPRSFPLDMSLQAATANGNAIALQPATSAVRDGDRITIDRGPIDEVYELSLDSVEQTFVVTDRPASGDLKLFVDLRSDLTRAATVEGIRFSNELGSVTYGQAFVRQADGTRLPVTSRMTAGGVEIQVDADVMARASYPLVVDPVITTFTLDNNAYDSIESDVAYDLSTDRHAVVYERVFNADDGDAYAIIREGNGSNSYFTYLDISVENWRSPQVANLNAANQFMVVAQVSNVTGALNWNIWGLPIDASTTVAGWKFLISTGDPTRNQVQAEIGGDSYDGPGGAYYCVTWRRDYSPTDLDIHARIVTSSSTLLGSGPILVDNSASTIDDFPGISKSNGILGGAAAWTIAWHRIHSGTETDIHAASVGWDGTIVQSTTPINTQGGRDYYPRVSSPLDDGRVLLVYAHFWPTDHDLYYSLLSGTTVMETGNLSSLEASGFLFQNQVEYSIDSDGQRFVVLYAEQYQTSTFDYDIWAMAVAPFGSSLGVTESHVLVDFSSEQSMRTDVVAQRSGGGNSRRFFMSWDNTANGANRDIKGGIYDRPLGGGYQRFCAGDGSIVACPCGNNGTAGRGCANSLNPSGAGLSATGDAQLGADTVSMGVDGVPPNVTCTLFQGSGAAATPFAFNDGLRCANGSLVRIRTKSASATGVAVWPTGSEADISVTGNVPLVGAQRYYQVTYRNAASFCTPATVNISNGMRVLWLP